MLPGVPLLCPVPLLWPVFPSSSLPSPTGGAGKPVWRWWGAGVRRSPASRLCWKETALNKSQAVSASAFKTTKMSSLVMLWSKYFGHLDATFCASEMRCIINLIHPVTGWADQTRILAAGWGRVSMFLSVQSCDGVQPAWGRGGWEPPAMRRAWARGLLREEKRGFQIHGCWLPGCHMG